MSLAPSRLIIDRGLAWSSNTNQNGHVSVAFPFDWNTRRGPIFDWYEKQPCKRFESIQHRQNQDAPFFHQFLLIRLTDGSLCRVERLGDGIQLDAIRKTGSLAHDLMETFTPDAYEIFVHDKPSDLIAEIRFPHEFDLMEVLAIYYSIQRDNRTRWYTLQRFNCYFLCWTILAVLARHLVDWQETFSTATWTDTVEDALMVFSGLSRAPLMPEAKLHLAIRLCSLLDPQCAHPAAFVINLLRYDLNGSDLACDSLNRNLEQTLWKSNWDTCVANALETKVKGILQEALDGDMSQSLLNDLAGNPAMLNYLQSVSEPQNLVVEQLFEEIYTGLGIKYVDRYIEEVANNGKILDEEYPPSMMWRMIRVCFGVTLGGAWGTWLAITDKGLGYGRYKFDS